MDTLIEEIRYTNPTASVRSRVRSALVLDLGVGPQFAQAIWTIMSDSPKSPTSHPEWIIDK